MGSIIYWGLLRFTLVLIGLWLARGYVENYGDWWTFFFFSVMAVVLYPAQLAYRKHFTRVRRIEKNVMCSSCKHYAADEALCTALDEAVTTIRIPCEGFMWEQKG